MRKVLILNGSHSEIPLILAAKRLGFFVITTGNAVDLPGHRLADQYEYQDFSDHEAIFRLAEAHDVSSICSCANDAGILSAAYAAEKLALRGHDGYQLTKKLHLKNSFKILAREVGIRTADSYEASSQKEAELILDNVDLPVLVKPVDAGGGSKGISVLTSRVSATDRVHHAFSSSKSKRVLIEEYIEGSHHSCSMFLVGGRVINFYSDDEHGVYNPLKVTFSVGPATNIDVVSSTLINWAETLSRKFSLVDGVLHFQYIYNRDGPCVIEVTRRCSGDIYSTPVSLALGFDWAEWLVRAESGLDCTRMPRRHQRGIFGRFCILAPSNGVIESISISADLKNFCEYEILQVLRPGDLVTDHENQKVAVIVLNFKNDLDRTSITRQMQRLVHIRMTD